VSDDEITRWLTADERAAFNGNARMLAESIARLRIALRNALKRAHGDDEPCPTCHREKDESHGAGCIFLAFPEGWR
jgi:hypothetical protein